MNSRDLKLAIKKIIKNTPNKGTTKKSRGSIANDITELIEGELFTLGDLQIMYDDFVETAVERGEHYRYADCFDMFVRFYKTGKTHPTLEELNAE